MTISRFLLLPHSSLKYAVVRRGFTTSSKLCSGHEPEYYWAPIKAGKREVVGHGINGDPKYMDRLDYWYPAIRFREDDDLILPIREKEKGDWKKLTIDEKKTLYRYSFRQTLAEFLAPSGYWKISFAIALSAMALATLYYTFLNHFVLQEAPPTMKNEYKEAIFRKKLILEKGMFMGPASYYDYERNRWKE